MSIQRSPSPTVGVVLVLGFTLTVMVGTWMLADVIWALWDLYNFVSTHG